MECLTSAAESPSAVIAAIEGDSIECLAAEAADMPVCASVSGGDACQATWKTGLASQPRDPSMSATRARRRREPRRALADALSR